MDRNSTVMACGLILVFVLACTPKTTEKTTASEPETKPKPVVSPPPPKKEDLSPCPKFEDAPNSEQVIEDFVLYRDFLRAGDWDNAFEKWQKVYAIAPAADGQRNTVYADGIRFYEHSLSKTTDASKKEALIDKVFEIYNEIDKCYPQGGYVAGRKAFDYFYKYPERASKEEQYALFKQSIDMDGKKSHDFIINPFTSLLVELHEQGKISTAEAQKYNKIIREIIEYGMENCEGNGCERWKIVQAYAPVRLEFFETVKGFYDCDYYKEKYYKEYVEAPDDCDVMRSVYSRLKWGNCPETDAQFADLIRLGNEKCTTAPGPIRIAYNCLENADYPCAIEGFEKAVTTTDDPVKKAKYTLLIAKIYHAYLKKFSKARNYAKKAAALRPNWGEPYLLIGRLYASSGPLCGPGRGWDSQIVTWPAIDMWQKAKRVDPGVAAEANKWIKRYSQYMPDVEDIFQRSLKEGEKFFVPCWIQEWTTIRAAGK